jgi:hypothetical protein
MPAANLKSRDFFSQGDSEKAKELADAFAKIEANIESLVTWGNTLRLKLNADGGVTDTNYAAPTL